jgi:hypothetical protein
MADTTTPRRNERTIAMGTPVLEIVARELFRNGEVWLVCEAPGPLEAKALKQRSGGQVEFVFSPTSRSLRLFVGHSEAEEINPAGSDFAEVRMDSAELEGLVSRFRECGVATPAALQHVGVADATTYEVAIHGGIQASCRLSWVAGTEPPAWAQITDQVLSTLAAFRRARAASHVD